MLNAERKCGLRYGMNSLAQAVT